MSPPSFSESVAGVGLFRLYPLSVPDHMLLIHDWVTRDYACYWGMQNASLEQVTSVYQEFERSGNTRCYLGFHEHTPAFLLECYDPGKAEVGQHYAVCEGDQGMHILVAPVTTRIPDFTFSVMRVIMQFLFHEPTCKRVVVEPDSRNKKIHILNQRVGFVVEREISLTEKNALLAFCSKDQFTMTTRRNTA